MSSLNGFVGVGAAIVDGLLTEPLAPAGYSRQPFTGQDLGGGSVTVASGVTFGPAAAAWDIGAVALFDAASAGDMLYSAAISPIEIAPGARLTLPAGTYALTQGATLDPAALTVDGVPLTFASQPLRML